MSKETRANNNLLETEVVIAMNTLIDAKQTSPKSERHKSTLISLAKIVANKPGAVDIISKLQKDN
ncbi:MAG: hypothetical protein HYT08_00145 [Candidatus Levybacteria bacterium]|nr:hypothetical protein [Candidatus Levybacteria bacterium]